MPVGSFGPKWSNVQLLQDVKIEGFTFTASYFIVALNWISCWWLSSHSCWPKATGAGHKSSEGEENPLISSGETDKFQRPLGRVPDEINDKIWQVTVLARVTITCTGLQNDRDLAKCSLLGDRGTFVPDHFVNPIPSCHATKSGKFHKAVGKERYGTIL